MHCCGSGKPVLLTLPTIRSCPRTISSVGGRRGINKEEYSVYIAFSSNDIIGFCDIFPFAATWFNKHRNLSGDASCKV